MVIFYKKHFTDKHDSEISGFFVDLKVALSRKIQQHEHAFNFLFVMLSIATSALENKFAEQSVQNSG